MKYYSKVLIIISGLIILSFGYKSDANTKIQIQPSWHAGVYIKFNPVDSNVHLKDFTRTNLDNFRLFPWFEYAYRDYVPDPLILDSLRLIKDHISIIVFGGSWCSDTHDLLPKFYKAVELAKIPADKITLIGVDRHKHSHDGKCWKYRIKKVPTFILFYDGKQIGRVVETVHTSIEADILNQYHKAGY